MARLEDLCLYTMKRRDNDGDGDDDDDDDDTVVMVIMSMMMIVIVCLYMNWTNIDMRNKCKATSRD